MENEANRQADAYQRELEEKKRKAELTPKELEDVVKQGIKQGAQLNLNIFPEAKSEESFIIKRLKADLAEYNIEYDKDADFNKEDVIIPLIQALKEAKEYSTRKPPSGTVRLNAQQLGYEGSQNTEDLVNYEGSCMDLSYDSQAQMLTVLKVREKRGDEEAKQILQELLNKMDFGKKEEEWVYEGSAKDMANRKNKWKKKER
jgi:hypothetical protein